MKSQGHDVINHTDDVIGFGTIYTTNASFCTLQNLLEKVGFEIRIIKLVQPTTKVTCLGVKVNTKEFTVSVPDDKLKKYFGNVSKLESQI